MKTSYKLFVISYLIGIIFLSTQSYSEESAKDSISTKKNCNCNNDDDKFVGNYILLGSNFSLEKSEFKNTFLNFDYTIPHIFDNDIFIDINLLTATNQDLYYKKNSEPNSFISSLRQSEIESIPNGQVIELNKYRITENYNSKFTSINLNPKYRIYNYNNKDNNNSFLNIYFNLSFEYINRNGTYSNKYEAYDNEKLFIDTIRNNSKYKIYSDFQDSVPRNIVSNESYFGLGFSLDYRKCELFEFKGKFIFGISSIQNNFRNINVRDENNIINYIYGSDSNLVPYWTADFQIGIPCGFKVGAITRGYYKNTTYLNLYLSLSKNFKEIQDFLSIK